jgi:hypothetical protein
MYENARIGCELMRPFLLKLKVIAEEELDQLLQQMLIEMHSEDFCGIWYFSTTWGNKPAVQDA